MRFDPVSVRRKVLEMAYSGGTVHIACAFSIVELLTVLYRNHLRFPGNDPDSPGRDYLLLSKGHGVMAQYACLHELGWLSDQQLENYFRNGTDLKGLSDAHVRGLEVSSGSLGHGFSIGVGISLGLKRQGAHQKVFIVVGDGELNEGPNWEAALFAAHHQLDNLMLVVDVNGFQAMGKTDEVMSLGDLPAKLAAFGFETACVDGHDEHSIDQAIRSLWATGSGCPKALLATTVKGKGVSFMESDNRWHYTRLDEPTFQQAMASLTALRA